VTDYQCRDNREGRHEAQREKNLAFLAINLPNFIQFRNIDVGLGVLPFYLFRILEVDNPCWNNCEEGKKTLHPLALVGYLNQILNSGIEISRLTLKCCFDIRTDFGYQISDARITAPSRQSKERKSGKAEKLIKIKKPRTVLPAGVLIITCSF